MADSTEDMLTQAAIAMALEKMDHAIGKPFDCGPMRTRTAAWLPACRGLPREAIEWAADAACKTLEKYPVAAQFRKLAQASPAYLATLNKRHDDHRQDEPVQARRCDHCQEPRAQHRVSLYHGAPRPFVAKVIRHRPDCPNHPAEGEDLQWVDPPAFGVVHEGAEAWTAQGIPWHSGPHGERGGEPTRIGEELSDEERRGKAEEYKRAAEEAKP